MMLLADIARLVQRLDLSIAAGESLAPAQLGQLSAELVIIAERVSELHNLAADKQAALQGTADALQAASASLARIAAGLATPA